MADFGFEEYDDGVGGGAGGEHAAVDPFADYQQPSSGVGFVDAPQLTSPPTTSSSPFPFPSSPSLAAPHDASPVASPAAARHKSPAPTSPQQAVPVDDENSPLRAWQREQQQRLAERQARSQEEHAKVRAAARADIDKFYEERRLHCQKAAQHNRSAQAELKKDEGSAKGWARCVQLIDLNAGRTEGKDVSRMRKILLEAKHGGLPLRAS